MTREELLVELRELERLYVEHGKNQRERIFSSRTSFV